MGRNKAEGIDYRKRIRQKQQDTHTSMMLVCDNDPQSFNTLLRSPAHVYLTLLEAWAEKYGQGKKDSEGMVSKGKK